MSYDLFAEIQQAVADVKAKDAARVQAAQALDEATKEWQKSQETLSALKAQLNDLLGPLVTPTGNVQMSV